MTPNAPGREVDSTPIEMPDWRQRLRDQLAAAAERREDERALRAQLAERRDRGLERRHAAKLGRRHGDRVSAQGPTTPLESSQDRSREADPPPPPEPDIHIPDAQAATLARLRRAGQGGWRPTRPETEH